MPNTLTNSIDAMLGEFTSVWNNGGRGLGDLFASDASLINPFGKRADGRAAISAMYDHFFGGMLAGTRSQIEVTDTRQVGDQHALIDATQTITAADGTPLLILHLAALLVRSDDGWRFLDSRPYSYATPPA